MQPTAIYIHWPFCEAKCPYCDFNSHVYETIPHLEYSSAYLKEIDRYSDYFSNHTIHSIFFGGGTPSLAHPQMFETILQHLHSKYNVAQDVEISMEANPTTFEAQKFKDFKKAGIKRLSLGIQSFNDTTLMKLGRTYKTIDAKKAIEEVAGIFNNYSIDFIYAHPWHTLKQWQAELQEAIEFAPYHMSLYQLTLEKGTKLFADYLKGTFTPIDQDLAADFYTLTQNLMHLDRYEISNHAKPGYECVHNMAYWNYQDYIGIGPGAHGRYTYNRNKWATVNIYNPNQWLQCINSDKTTLMQEQSISNTDAADEQIMMQLRLSKGIEKTLISQKARYNDLVNSNLIEEHGEIARTTEAGTLLLNHVLKELLTAS